MPPKGPLTEIVKMGGFFVVRHDRTTHHVSLVQRLEGCLRRQGFEEPRRVDGANYSLRVYPKWNVADDNVVFGRDGDFAFATGTVIYRGRHGAEAIRGVLTDFDPARFDPNDLYGHFCIGVSKGGSLYLFTDRLGLYNVYRDLHDHVYSNSFLAVCESLEAVQVNTQSLYEYVFIETTYGNKTVFEEIESIPAHCIVRISEGVTSLRQKEWVRPGVASGSLDDHVKASLAVARRYFSWIRDCFDGRVVTALSGGYDSRLMLALLREQGVKFSVYVYGKPEKCDVRIASEIARGEGFTLDCIDKSAQPKPERDAFAAIVEKNFYAFDGYPGDGIFDNGSDLSTRIDRSRGGKLMLNGAGAEYLRETWPIARVRLTPLGFVSRCICGYSPDVGTSRFCEDAFLKSLAEKVSGALGSDRSLLGRREMELAWITFQSRYFLSRNCAINNRFSWALLPLLGTEMIAQGLSVPVEYRFSGQLEGGMIREASPALAGYQSQYGHDFLHEAPLRRRVLDALGRLRTTYLPMRYAHRLKNAWRRWRKAKNNFPYYLQTEYLTAVIDPTFPYLSEFLEVDRVVDPKQYTRICTLEYLLQKIRPRVSAGSP